MYFNFVTVPPENVQITIQPTELKPGEEATLTCNSSPSNPPAVITWWKDGLRELNTNTSISDGYFFSTSSTSVLKLKVSKNDNGKVITCQSANEKLQQSVHEVLTLQVLCM